MDRIAQRIHGRRVAHAVVCKIADGEFAMDRRWARFLIFVAGALLIAGRVHAAGASGMTLTQGWAIQSSADVREGGAALSTVGYKVEDWYPTTVPSTVLAALVAQR